MLVQLGHVVEGLDCLLFLECFRYFILYDLVDFLLLQDVQLFKYTVYVFTVEDLVQFFFEAPVEFFASYMSQQVQVIFIFIFLLTLHGYVLLLGRLFLHL